MPYQVKLGPDGKCKVKRTLSRRTYLANRNFRDIPPEQRCDCNRKDGGEADYPAKKEPWRCLKFYCVGCRRWMPWCRGCADDMPDHCDDCWVKAHSEAA